MQCSAMNELAVGAQGWLYTPTADEAYMLLEDFRQEVGTVARLAAVLGVSGITLSCWLQRRRAPDRPSRAWIWFAWSLAYNPDNLVRLREQMIMGCSSHPRGKKRRQARKKRVIR